MNVDSSSPESISLKPNQQLLHLNRLSAHSNHVFTNIPYGVCDRLAKLTTLTKDNMNSPMHQLYTRHFQGLRQAELMDDDAIIPTLAEALQDVHERESFHTKQKSPEVNTVYCSMATTDTKVGRAT